MNQDEVPLFDEFSRYYDLFVNWPRRLANELPFLRDQLARVGAHRVLDSAGGTGMHAIALAQEGFEVTCAELSGGMLRRAGENIARAGVKVIPVSAGFGQLRQRVAGDYDTVLCLGNSLPHTLTREDLVAALADFAAVLRPGGIVIIQNRNYDKVLAEQVRFMPLETAKLDGKDVLFLRFIDFGADLLTFNMLTLRKEGDGWQYEVGRTQHRPIPAAEAEVALRTAGFRDWDLYGDYQATPFDPGRSGDLIIVARR